MTDFGFASTFNMGYEGFSRPLPLPRMNPIYGTKSEIFFVLAFFALLFPLIASRKKNEDALRAQIKSTNRYAALPLNTEQRQFT